MALPIENVYIETGAIRSTELFRREGGVASGIGRKSESVVSLKLSSNIFKEDVSVIVIAFGEMRPFVILTI